MFPNLNAEIGRAKLTIKRLSEITNINYETLKLKLRGVTEFKLAEMISIKKNAFPDKTLDYLFQTDEEKKTGQGVVKDAGFKRSKIIETDERRNMGCE